MTAKTKSEQSSEQSKTPVQPIKSTRASRKRRRAGKKANDDSQKTEISVSNDGDNTESTIDQTQKEGGKRKRSKRGGKNKNSNPAITMNEIISSLRNTFDIDTQTELVNIFLKDQEFKAKMSFLVKDLEYKATVQPYDPNKEYNDQDGDVKVSFLPRKLNNATVTVPPTAMLALSDMNYVPKKIKKKKPVKAKSSNQNAKTKSEKQDAGTKKISQSDKN